MSAGKIGARSGSRAEQAAEVTQRPVRMAPETLAEMSHFLGDDRNRLSPGAQAAARPANLRHDAKGGGGAAGRVGPAAEACAG